MELPLDFSSKKSQRMHTSCIALKGVNRIRTNYTWAACISALRRFSKDHKDKLDLATEDALKPSFTHPLKRDYYRFRRPTDC